MLKTNFFMIKLKNSIAKLHEVVLITLLLANTIYAIMELSGNVKERTVSIGNATARNFTVSLQGNVLLTNDGFCGNATWRDYVPDKVIDIIGAWFRAAAWNTSSIFLLASDRICNWQLYDT
jgi:hypothetical protein